MSWGRVMGDLDVVDEVLMGRDGGCGGKKL